MAEPKGNAKCAENEGRPFTTSDTANRERNIHLTSSTSATTATGKSMERIDNGVVTFHLGRINFASVRLALAPLTETLVQEDVATPSIVTSQGHRKLPAIEPNSSLHRICTTNNERRGPA